MNLLKTVIAAGVVAAATFTGAAGANAAERIVIHKNHGRVVETIHRAPVRIAVRAPILVGGWYAERTVYHPYAYYRGNPRLNACFAVTQKGFAGHRHALFTATMCYGKNGTAFVVPTSKHMVRFL